MRRLDLIIESKECVARRISYAENDKGEAYCKLYYPNTGRELYTCPLLIEQYVNVERGFTTIPFWKCERKDLGPGDLLSTYKIMKKLAEHEFDKEWETD